MKKYLLITTGGTIDAEPYPDPENPPKNAVALHHSLAAKHFREIMATKGLVEGVDFDVLHWRSKDSKKFTRADIDDLAQIINTAPHEKIIVTHGTDRMIRNSARVTKALGVSDKTVVFTGAMVPLSNDVANIAVKNSVYFSNKGGHRSDGRKNIEDAVKAVNLLHAQKKTGTYIAFHGRLFDPQKSRKNFALKRFESDYSIAI